MSASSSLLFRYPQGSHTFPSSSDSHFEEHLYRNANSPYPPDPPLAQFPLHFAQPQTASASSYPLRSHPQHTSPSLRQDSALAPTVESNPFFYHLVSPPYRLQDFGSDFPQQHRDGNFFEPTRRQSDASDVTLHEATHFSPIRSGLNDQRSTSPLPFPHHLPSATTHETTYVRPSDGYQEDGKQARMDWERTVEEEVRKRLELERRLGGFAGQHETVNEYKGPQSLRDRQHSTEIAPISRSLSMRSTISSMPELPPQPEVLLFDVGEITLFSVEKS